MSGCGRPGRVLAATLALGVALAGPLGVPTVPAAAQGFAAGTTAVLRGLDKLSGATQDLDIPVGQQASYGRLRITALGCRYPSANPNADAFAFLQIDDLRSGERLFQGWMIASAPALNALDDARYDVWVLSCR